MPEKLTLLPCGQVAPCEVHSRMVVARLENGQVRAMFADEPECGCTLTGPREEFFAVGMRASSPCRRAGIRHSSVCLVPLRILFVMMLPWQPRRRGWKVSDAD